MLLSFSRRLNLRQSAKFEHATVCKLRTCGSLQIENQGNRLECGQLQWQSGCPGEGVCGIGISGVQYAGVWLFPEGAGRFYP